MDKQTFASIQATTNTSRYAAAVFRKGAVKPQFTTGLGTPLGLMQEND